MFSRAQWLSFFACLLVVLVSSSVLQAQVALQPAEFYEFVTSQGAAVHGGDRGKPERIDWGNSSDFRGRVKLSAGVASNTGPSAGRISASVTSTYRCGEAGGIIIWSISTVPVLSQPLPPSVNVPVVLDASGYGRLNAGGPDPGLPGHFLYGRVAVAVHLTTILPDFELIYEEGGPLVAPVGYDPPPSPRTLSFNVSETLKFPQNTEVRFYKSVVVRICGLGFATAGFDPIFYIDPGATFLLNGQSIRFADAFRLIVSSNLVDEHRRPIFESVDTWRFLDDGSNQGTDWRATDFNDTAWPQGRAEFGFGDGDEATTVRFGAHPADKHVTTYFRKDFQSELPQAQLQSLELDLIRDDGVAIYLNGVEIYRHNLSTDARFDTLAQSEIGESDEFRPQVLHINVETLPPGTWRQGRNVLAAEVHLASPDNADMSFAMSLMVRVVPDETKVKPRPFK